MYKSKKTPLSIENGAICIYQRYHD